jgi:hypothetical protein
LSLKLVPAALLLLLAVAIGVGQTLKSADAEVSGDLVPSATSMESGATPISILVPLDAVNPTDDVTVTILGLDGNANMTGLLLLQGCVPGCPADAGESTDSDATPIVVETDNQTQLVLRLGLTCTVDDTVTVTAFTGDASDAHSTFIDCIAVEEPPAPEAVQGGQVAATATPNLLPCEGGTSTIKADVVDHLGNVLVGAEFRFETTAGLLVQTGPDTAKLTLASNQTLATVTAKIFDPDPNAEAPKTATVVIALVCNGDSSTQTLVVTASPNVIECTGTTTITASVRDRNGHVVKGRGYHFYTSAGLLTVSPNNADTEEAVATLSLKPGDGDATVAVSSGLLLGTYEELDGQLQGQSVGNEPNFVVDETNMVTVKQNCLSTTTGQIKVNSSAATVGCGENVFIGLSVIDSKLQTVIDQTPLTLIATAGGFYGGVDTSTGLQTLLPAAQVPTSHGEANTIYTAPTNFSGEVKITAASGDAYGFTKINVTCVVAVAGTGTGSAACIDIGDGVCITPPNTGRNSITPPNTGDAGLK